MRHVALLLLLSCSFCFAQEAERLERIEKQITELKALVEGLKPAAAATNAAAETKKEAPKDPIARIRDEGMNRSEAMATLTHLTEVIGPRLTGSPALKRANEWTRERLESWGLQARVEPWGEFGRGWTLKRFSAQVVEPLAFPVVAHPKAWSPGLEKPLQAEVALVDTTSTENMEKHKGKLKGKIAFISRVREVNARFEPLATRYDEAGLLRLANAPEGRLPPAAVAKAETQARAQTPRPRPEGGVTLARALAFLEKEGAAAAVTSSQQGDGGAVFVTGATVPGAGFTNNPNQRIWGTNVTLRIPQIMMAVEDYNRIARMIKNEQTVRMELDLRVEFDDEDFTASNTIAEIPGTDLKDEVVMMGAHLDSWHGGSGATDNGVGVAAMMEAARILQTLELKPRRTIRVALWTGEEQGLFGSKSYVTNHFGYFTNIVVTNVAAASEKKEETNAPSTTNKKFFVKKPAYEQISAYFNLDYGPGKIRGICLEGNEALRPLFREWLTPFRDLGAETVSASSLGSTDHVSFDAVGIPGFQFIQDPLEYMTRTHHSTLDVLDRIQAEDLKQAATIIAAFVYNTAMQEAKLTRKKAPEFYKAEPLAATGTNAQAAP